MNEQPRRGVSRAGLDAPFEADEAAKSNLLLESQLLRARGRHDEAASKLAEAAPVEERLARACLDKGLPEKAWVHWFSAVSCWAVAGNFYAAIRLGGAMLARPDLPERQRRRVEEYTQALRNRLSQWAAEEGSPGVRVNGGPAAAPTTPEAPRT